MQVTGRRSPEVELELGVSRLLRENQEQLRRLEDRHLDDAAAKLVEVWPEAAPAVAVLVDDHRARRAERERSVEAFRRFWFLVEQGAGPVPLPRTG